MFCTETKLKQIKPVKPFYSDNFHEIFEKLLNHVTQIPTSKDGTTALVTTDPPSTSPERPNNQKVSLAQFVISCMCGLVPPCATTQTGASFIS
jgi:hypothetical protein